MLNLCNHMESLMPDAGLTTQMCCHISSKVIRGFAYKLGIRFIETLYKEGDLLDPASK